MAATETVIGKCIHCGVAQFDNPNADPALDGMAHLCWKCVRPHGCTYPPRLSNQGYGGPFEGASPYGKA